VYWRHWTGKVIHFYSLESDYRILANAPGGTIKSLNSLYCTRYGQFEWIMSPIGPGLCPALFSRLVEMALSVLVNFIVFIDDILLHSKNHFNHNEQLKLFNRLMNAGLKINLAKWEFVGTNVSCLG
jgi:hypothetical protein